MRPGEESRDVLRKDVRPLPSLINALAEHGIEEWGAKTPITGYRLLDRSAEPFDGGE